MAVEKGFNASLQAMENIVSESMVINRNQGALVVKTLADLENTIGSEKSQNDVPQKSLTSIFESIRSLFASCSSERFLDLLLDPKVKGSNGAAFDQVFTQIECISRSSSSSLDRLEAEYLDLLEIEQVFKEHTENLCETLKLQMPKFSTEQLLTLVDSKLDVIQRHRVLLSMQLLKSLSSESAAQSIIYLFSYLCSDISSMGKELVQWRRSLLLETDFTNIQLLVRDLIVSLDRNEIFIAELIYEHLVSSIEEAHSISQTIVIVCEFGSFVRKVPKSWSTTHQVWMENCVSFYSSNSEALFDSIRYQVVHVFQSLTKEVSDDFCTSVLKCSSLSDLKQIILQWTQSSDISTKYWELYSFVWENSFINARLCDIPPLLIELEHYNLSVVLLPDWSQLRPIWLQKLGIGNDPRALDTFKNLFIQYLVNILPSVYKDTDFRSETKLRNGIFHCNSLSSLKRFLNVFLGRIRRNILSSEWRGLELSWKTSVAHSESAIELAIFLLDFHHMNSFPMTKGWPNISNLWDSQVRELSASTHRGRFSIGKSRTMLFLASLNESIFHEPNQKELLSLVSSSKTILEACTGLISILENISAPFKSRTDPLLERAKNLNPFDPRSFCNIVLDCFNSFEPKFFKKLFTTAFQSSMLSVLSLSRQSYDDELQITILKSLMHTFIQYINPSILVTKWSEIAAPWTIGMNCQIHVSDVFNYIQSFHSFLLDEGMAIAGGRKFHPPSERCTVGSVSAYLLEMDRAIDQNMIYYPWPTCSFVWRNVLLQWSLSETFCHLHIVKLAYVQVGNPETGFPSWIGDSSVQSAAARMIKEHQQSIDTDLKDALEMIKSNNDEFFQVTCLKYSVAALFSRLKNRSFLYKPFYIEDTTELSGQLSRIKTILDCDSSVKAISTLALEIYDSLHPDAIQPFFEDKISETFRSTLQLANSYADISSALTVLVEHLDGASVLHSETVWPIFATCVAQSLRVVRLKAIQPVRQMIQEAYGLPKEEFGHSTLGHLCLDERDVAESRAIGMELLFGELLSEGVSSVMDNFHLNANNARTLCDLGMGVGKLAMQCFLSFKNLTHVLGVELARTRYAIGEQACLKLCDMHPNEFSVKFHESIDVRNLRIAIQDSQGRVLEFRKQNLFVVGNKDNQGIAADIVVAETLLPKPMIPKLCKLLSTMKKGARVLSYENLDSFYRAEGEEPFTQVPCNVSPDDTFLTTWSPQRGQHLFVWEKTQ